MEQEVYSDARVVDLLGRFDRIKVVQQTREWAAWHALRSEHLGSGAVPAHLVLSPEGATRWAHVGFVPSRRFQGALTASLKRKVLKDSLQSALDQVRSASIRGDVKRARASFAKVLSYDEPEVEAELRQLLAWIRARRQFRLGQQLCQVVAQYRPNMNFETIQDLFAFDAQGELSGRLRNRIASAVDKIVSTRPRVSRIPGPWRDRQRRVRSEWIKAVNKAMSDLEDIGGAAVPALTRVAFDQFSRVDGRRAAVLLGRIGDPGAKARAVRGLASVESPNELQVLCATILEYGSAGHLPVLCRTLLRRPPAKVAASIVRSIDVVLSRTYFEALSAATRDLVATSMISALKYDNPSIRWDVLVFLLDGRRFPVDLRKLVPLLSDERAGSSFQPDFSVGLAAMATIEAYTGKKFRYESGEVKTMSDSLARFVERWVRSEWPKVSWDSERRMFVRSS